MNKWKYLSAFIIIIISILFLNSCASIKSIRRDDRWFTWERHFGGADEDAGKSAVQLSDGSYVIAGVTRSFKAVDNDIYLLGVDPAGELIWQRNYGGGGSDDAAKIIISRDHNLVVVGSSSSTPDGQSDIYLFKVNREGELIWDRMLGGHDYEDGSDVIELPDGGLAVIGTTRSYGAGNTDIYLARLNKDGEILWEKTFGGADLDHGSALTLIPGGDFLILGWSKSFGNQREDFYLARVNHSGSLVWQKTFGGPGIDYAMSLTTTHGNGCVFTGRTTSEKTEAQVISLYNIDSLGNVLWNKTYDDLGDGGGNAVIRSSDSSCILTGWYNSKKARGEIPLINVGSGGVSIWGRSYGGVGEDTGWDIIPTRDGGHFIVGRTTSFSNGPGDVFLIKTDEQGLIGNQ
nr:hypothetical protein [candidate division Zixibacteria bacterium]